MDLIKKLKKADNFWDLANSLNEDQLAVVIKTAADHYYNTKTPLISDEIYDALIDRLKSINPNHEVLTQTGAPVKGKKVKLPYWLGSMDKIKGDEKPLKKWLSEYEGPYVISDKLDGMSCLLTLKGGEFKLYSRGDGEYGQDVTHLLENLPINTKGLEKSGKKHDPIAIRGELIMKKKTFEKHYSKTNPNARNLVAGIMNSKPTSVKSEDVKRLNLIFYEIVEPSGYLPLNQLEVLESWGVSVVPYETYDKLSLKILDKTLTERRKESEYEIDGLIVTDNNKHKRNVSDNPDYAFAYKGMTETAQVKVTRIHWSPSKDGRIIPRIEFEPVKLSGATLTYATGFNAKFVVDNKLGKGAIIEVVRSGDVIPYVLEIIKQAKKADLPDKVMEYEWDENKVHIVLKNAELNETVIVKVITRFLKTLEVDNLSEGLVARLVEAGYDNIIKIVRLKKKDFLELEGFKEKLSEELYTNLQNALANVDILKLMVGSNVFGTGFGSRKLVKVLETYPKIVDQYSISSYDSWLVKLNEIEGWDTTTSKAFLEALPLFQEFYQKISKYITVKPFKTTKSTEGSFKDQVIVFTGFRNNEWQKKIESQGGRVSGSVSGHTTLLVYADSDKGKGLKYNTAIKKGIKTLSEAQFKKIIEG